MTLRLSQRAALPDRENRLTALVRARRDSGQPWIDLTTSNPTQVGLDLEAAGDPLDALTDPRAHRYAPDPLGLLSAREALAAHLGASADHIALTASTSEAYAALFKLLCDPGDDVLIGTPSYPLFEHLARFEGVGVRPYLMRWDGAWHIDHGTVRPGPRTRAIVVVSPNNPTGHVTEPGELRRLASHGLPLVVDEVFAPYPLERSGPFPSAATAGLDVPVFALGGLSKSAGLPQLKLAWTVVSGPEEDARRAAAGLEILLDASLSAAGPVMVGLPRLLELGARRAERIGRRVRDNLARLRAALAGVGVIDVPRVEAGWVAALRLPRIMGDDQWACELLERDGVLVQPGYFYDFPSEAWLVVSLLVPPDRLDEGLARLASRVGERSS